MPHITLRPHPLRGDRSVRRTAAWALAPVALLCAGIVVIGLGAAALVGHRLLPASDPAATPR